MLSALREKLIKIAAKVAHRAKHITFQMVEVAVPRAGSPLELQLDEAIEFALANESELIPEPRALRVGESSL